MLPSCRQVAEQLSENIDEPITGMKWFKIKVHLAMCKYCRRYGSQIKLADETATKTISKSEPSIEVKEKVEEHYKELHVNKPSKS